MRAKILAATIVGGALLAGGGYVAMRHTEGSTKEKARAELIGKRDLNLVTVNAGLAKLNDGSAVLTQAPAPKVRHARRAHIDPISNVVQLTPIPTQVQAAPQPEPEVAPVANLQPEHPAAGPSAQPDEPVYTPGSIAAAKGRWAGTDAPAPTDGNDGTGMMRAGTGRRGGGGGECHGRGRARGLSELPVW